jgi:crossover junction endodeoxyribonuclease RuvC
MVVLGIDPGFGVTGFAILKKEMGKAVLLDYGYLKLNPTKSLAERLALFNDFFIKKITDHGVTNLALETPFLGKNTQSFLKLGYLRGCLYLLSHQHKLTLHEFSPREVKLSVTGFGGASKEQVSMMILRLFPRLQLPEKLDVTDALAVTLCGLWQVTTAHQLAQAAQRRV